jgi:TatD DNase family protein
VFHCFTGGEPEARACVERGAFVSFSGIVTFKSATDVQAAARFVPADRLLIETDAPYLAPVPHRGKTNQPAWVGCTAQFLADLRDVPVDELADTTFANGCAAFPAIGSPHNPQ